MSTLTIATPASVSNGSGYASNVFNALRALFAAIFAVNTQTAASSKDDVSLYRLYRLAGSYDSVMPNLAQELNTIAKRA